MRSTKINIELNRIFQDSSQPLTVRDILIRLNKAGIKPNKTTVYRQLEKMARKRDLEHVHFEGRGLGYEKAREHHHHLVCKNCSKVEDLFIEGEEKILNKILAKKSFEAYDHHLEIFGLCRTCR